MLRNSIIVVLLLIASINAKAQFIKSKSIDVSAGFGLSSPSDEYDITGNGVYAQGEYVLELSKWIDIRSYAGFVFTGGNNDNAIDGEPDYEVTTDALSLGGKIRLTAPIPYVAPYLEIGIGASIGSFITFTPTTDIEKKGIISHVPFTIGLELGKNRDIDLAFVYYYQNSVEQFTGAAAIGISIPLASKGAR